MKENIEKLLGKKMDSHATTITFSIGEKDSVAVNLNGGIDADIEQNINHSMTQILPLVIGLVENQKARMVVPTDSLEIGRGEFAKLMTAEMLCYGLVAQAVKLLGTD